MRREPRQPFFIGCFQVDGDAVSKLHQALDLSFFNTRHDLEMHVSTEAKSFAQNLCSVQNFVLCVRAARRDPGTKEDALCHARLI